MSYWKVLVVLFFPVFLFTLACENQTPASTEEQAAIVVGNPAAEGFNAAASDAKAIELADKVMEANGGRATWDNTRHFRWNFFGRRDLWWDKQTGNVRIESTADSMTYLINVKEDTGEIMRKGIAITEPDTIKKYIQQGKNIWINDSYWLVFPFKLKDSGVTLKYMGQDSTKAGALQDVVQLTFEEVGRTPQNRYLAYVDSVGMISQWDFYTNAADTVARFALPWLDYQTHGGLKLSSDRGMAKLSNIAVYDELPAAVYEDFAWQEEK